MDILLDKIYLESNKMRFGYLIQLQSVIVCYKVLQ